MRYTSPATAEEALRIAITVSEAEIQEARDNAFYVDAEVAEITPAGRLREPTVHHTTAKKSVGGAANVRKPHRADQQPSKQRLQVTRSNATRLSAKNAAVMGTLRVIVRTGDRLKGPAM